MDLPTTSDFERIVLGDLPLIDVRAPAEFESGAFPNAVNLPLLDNEERRLVGIRYKSHGNEAAVQLGQELVCGEVKQRRINDWAEQLRQHPGTLLYCFRGGQRSQIAQQWLAEETSLAVPRLEGGYKAFRTYLIEQLGPAHQTYVPVMLGGRTGSGKTTLLQSLENAIDLERIANHRGSTFGRFTRPQPTPIDFENRLAWALIQRSATGRRHIVIEDEGGNIGHRTLPRPLVAHYRKAALVILERPMEDRVQAIFDEYVLAAQTEYREAYGDPFGVRQWFDDMECNLDRIRKRLGGQRHGEIRQLLQTAHTGCDPEQHKVWIERLLRDYYDPMYDYQIQQRSAQIVFQGAAAAVLEYLRALP